MPGESKSHTNHTILYEPHPPNQSRFLDCRNQRRSLGGLVRLLLIGIMLVCCLLHIALFYGRANVKRRQKMVSDWADRLLYLLNMKVDFQLAVARKNYPAA
ncbi:MAG: hypothetical protein IPO38_13375 [Rhodocyclaceae bacterium]|nr:hypothetical protein [Rhodocyclaceae bacterium]